MKAAIFRKYGKPEVINIEEIEKPQTSGNQILVNIKATSVNPIDTKIRSGALKVITGKKFPKTIGADFSGVVAESNHQDYKVGDEVFGITNFLTEGCNAEYIAVKPEQITNKPKNIDFFKSAAVSLVGVTTIQIIDRIKMNLASKNILINGCAGGVGSNAVQIFKAKGGNVTGVCSTQSFAFAKKLGLENIIDYKKMDIYSSPKFNVVFDTIGNINIKKAKKILNDDGVFISLSPTPSNILKGFANYAFNSRKAIFYSVKPEQKSLKELSSLLEKRLVVPPIEKVFTYKELPAAHKKIESGHVQGKLVVIWA